MQHTDIAVGSSSDPEAAYHGGYSHTGAEKLESRLAALYDLIEPPAWHADAACVGTSPDLFYNDDRKAEGAAICAGCPVRQQCSDTGIGEYGIWGGIDRDAITVPPAAADKLTEAILSAVRLHPFEFSRRELGIRVRGAEAARIRYRIRLLIAEGTLVAMPVTAAHAIERRTGNGRLQTFTMVQTIEKIGLA